MSAILVTGAGGFVGRHLVPVLAEKHDLILLDQAPCPYHGLRLKHIPGDILDPSSFSGISEKVAGIIHLAGISRVKDGEKEPALCLQVNVCGTVNVLEWARTHPDRPWTIVAGTVETAGNTYGLSKQMAQMCAQHYAHAHDLMILMLQFATIYGMPGDRPDKVLPTFFRAALANEPLTVNNADLFFDFIHIHDIVRAIELSVALLTTKDHAIRSYSAVPICTGQWTSLHELARKIHKICRSRSEIRCETEPVDIPAPLDTSVASGLLSFHAEIPLDKGLDMCARHFISNHP